MNKPLKIWATIAVLSLARLLPRLAPAFIAAIVAILVCVRGFGAESQVRPIWGSEALWGYWEFGSDYLSKIDWKLVSVSHEAAAPWKAQNLIDDDPETFYYPNGHDFYEVVIDLGHSRELGAFTILTLGRPNAANDSRMARYECYVGKSNQQRGLLVARGDFVGEEGQETVVTFPATRGRYVTLKAFARPNAFKEVCIREFNLVSAEAVKRHAAAKAEEAARRQAVWENRNSTQAVEALGREFVSMLFCTSDDINRSNLRARPKLEQIGKLKAAGQYAEALRVFREYYFDKLRRPQAFGIHANDVHLYGGGFGGLSDFPQGALDKNLDSDGQAKHVAVADELLKGRMTMANGAQVLIGEPGTVDWNAPGPPYGYTTKSRTMYPYRELWWGTGFQPLFTAYIVTKDEKYLKRWVAYMDDWALNSTFLGEVHPVLNHDDSLYPVVSTLRMFAGIANTLPFQSEAVSPQAFARIMKKLVLESPLTRAVYFRSNSNAWTPGAGQMLFAMLIDEFKVAPLYFRETRRRNIEDINVLQGLRDGTESHQWPGYNFLLLCNAGALRLMDARDNLPTWAQPVWERDLHDPAWQRELTDALENRASYVLHWGTPSGEYPLVTHQEPPSEKKMKLREAYNRVPSMLNDPTNAKLYSTLYGDGACGKPDYTAEWFPYGGYSIVRVGWKREDGYGAMFCSPRPGCGGVGSGCKNNIFGLAAYGMDLIADDLVHAYVRPTSPIQVDQKRQQFDYYIPKTTWPTGHRGDLLGNWTEPSPWRWHASDDFNLMEGNYSGVYANDFHNRKEFIDDVSHQRLALFVRRAGMWIITDRMRTAKTHDYDQIWWLPLQRNQSAAFRPEEIVVDAAARTIKTRRTRSDTWWSWDQMRDISVGNVNLSMYQFSDAALKYQSTTRKDNSEMYDWQRVDVNWQGTGDQQIVTVLFPRKPTPEKKRPDGTENDLAGIKPLPAPRGVTAIDATTPEGLRVTYLAANHDTYLENEGLKIIGEALLLVHGPAAENAVRGIALGCQRMLIGGVDVAVSYADFEFALPASLAADKLTVTPIYRPISPVRILPESDVFVDELEVSLRSDTPGVAMTYTLDGTKPTPQSTPYRGPFKIDRTLVVKARAYRPGVEKNPPQTSGTHATPTSHALFTKRLACRAELVMPRNRGLNYEYYEDFWKDLWLARDTLKPKRKGAVTELFDMTVIPDDNRPVGDKPGPREKAYAFQYTGYLKAPEDGVYTIHAPYEYTHCDWIAGYELQVYLGHALHPDGNRVKRDEDLAYWYPATRLHGFGDWSVPLTKGFHEIKIVYIDFRMDGAKRMNRVKGVRDCVWSGEKPELLLSGPGISKRPIPADWLWRE